jgi:hypothetical protein
MSLKQDILKESNSRGWDPFTRPFKPSDLGLNANQYGSFSDYCASNETISGQYNPSVVLKVAERSLSRRPKKYLLIP